MYTCAHKLAFGLGVRQASQWPGFLKPTPLGTPLSYREIPYHTGESLRIQGNPLGYREIPYYTGKSLIMQGSSLLCRGNPFLYIENEGGTPGLRNI